jgi:hypothetical protein
MVEVVRPDDARQHDREQEQRVERDREHHLAEDVRAIRPPAPERDRGDDDPQEEPRERERERRVDVEHAGALERHHPDGRRGGDPEAEPGCPFLAAPRLAGEEEIDPT